MKKTLLLPAVLMLQSVVFGQELIGNWRIDHLVGIDAETEYRLTPPDSNEHHIYGNRLELHADGTFISAYSATCGNDCFRTNSGVYELPDEHHIRLTLHYIHTYKQCEQLSIDTSHHVGLFYIHSDSAGIALIRSEGDSIKDQERAGFSALIDTFFSEKMTRKPQFYDENVLPWKQCDTDDPVEVVRFYVKAHPQLEPMNVELLHAKKMKSFQVILLRTNRGYAFLVHDLYYQKVAMY